MTVALGVPALALLTVRALVDRATRDPAAFVPWLPNQVSFLTSMARVKQIRQGNQWGGKTWAALAEVIGRCVGRHPLGDRGFDYPRPGPGFEAWVICDSWSQAVQVMAKIWVLLPKDDIDPGTVYEPTRGFRGKNPCIRFRNGAILRIKTANQDPKSLASGTIDVALFDEPPPDERVYTEVWNRLQAKGGVLLLSYTPVNAPVEYLRKYVADGLIEDHWSRLTAEALIPVGRDRPMRGLDGVLRDQAWIDELRRRTPPVQAPVVIDGEWEFRSQGAYFEGAWDPVKMVLDRDPATRPGEFYLLGVDHAGERPGGQVAHLMLVDPDHVSGHPAVHVLDEYTATPGRALTEHDAAGIVMMIQRHGLTWGELRFVGGDAPVNQGKGNRKSNQDLHAAIAKVLGQPSQTLKPIIKSIKRGEGRGSGSVGIRSFWLYQQMARGCFTVNRRCARLIEALPKYVGNQTDPAKDPVDSVVYGCDVLTYGAWKRQASRPYYTR